MNGVRVKKLLAVAAVTLAMALTGCSKAEPPTAAATVPASSAPATTTNTPTDTSTSGTTTSEPTAGVTTTGKPGTTPSKVAVDQSSPEAAMTSWLNAMFAGDKEAVCALMASGGKAIADVPKAVETCSSMIGGMLDQLEPLAGAFKGLTIEGATVSGDSASFESATTEPAMAAQIIRSFKAVRINGDWYVTQG